MEDMLVRVHTAACNAGLQIFVEQAHWFPPLQDLNELVDQVADDEAQYQHIQIQLQHRVWLLSQPPGYKSDEEVPGEVTQVTACCGAHAVSITGQLCPDQHCDGTAKMRNGHRASAHSNGCGHDYGSLCYVGNYEPDAQLYDEMFRMKVFNTEMLARRLTSTYTR